MRQRAPRDHRAASQKCRYEEALLAQPDDLAIEKAIRHLYQRFAGLPASGERAARVYEERLSQAAALSKWHVPVTGEGSLDVS
ncbi:MAG: hypothetical protein AAF674_11130 [Pseudomonadota bacterium]